MFLFSFLRRCRTRNVADAHVGQSSRTWVLACGRTIKFHFCRANVFELAIKQRFSPPSQRTTRPRRGVGPFSFFVYSPTNWFCGIHRPFFSSSSSPSSTPFSPAVSQGSPELFRGTQIHPARVRGVPTSGHSGHQPRVTSSTKVSVVQNLRVYPSCHANL